MKPKRTSTSRKTKTTNVVEENKDAGTTPIPEIKPEMLKKNATWEMLQMEKPRLLRHPFLKGS